jgi:hypothetical protein
MYNDSILHLAQELMIERLLSSQKTAQEPKQNRKLSSISVFGQKLLKQKSAEPRW